MLWNSQVRTAPYNFSISVSERRCCRNTFVLHSFQLLGFRVIIHNGILLLFSHKIPSGFPRDSRLIASEADALIRTEVPHRCLRCIWMMCLCFVSYIVIMMQFWWLSGWVRQGQSPLASNFAHLFLEVASSSRTRAQHSPKVKLFKAAALLTGDAIKASGNFGANSFQIELKFDLT